MGELLGEEPETKLVDPEGMDTSKMLLRVIVDTAEGDKVRVNLPVAILTMLAENDSLMDMMTNGKGNALKGIDFKQIVAMVSMGVMGKIVEVESGDANVSIWVE